MIQQKLTRRKEKLEIRVKLIKQDLAQVDGQLRFERILDTAWKDQKKSLDEQVGFILHKIDDIDSEDSMLELQDVVNIVSEASRLLCKGYSERIKESRIRRAQKEKRNSDELLSLIDVPWFPDFIKEYIKKKFTIKSEQEATT